MSVRYAVTNAATALTKDVLVGSALRLAARHAVDRDQVVDVIAADVLGAENVPLFSFQVFDACA
jgi:hypothetical protein